MLTAGQIHEFKRDGVLKLEGFFSAQEVDIWRGQILDFFHNPSSGEEWREAIIRYKSSRVRLKDGPSPTTHSALQNLYRDLHGTARWIGKSELRIRPPDLGAIWTGARTPHLDFPIFGSVRTLANNMIYLSDVEDRGGAFMYWPGSHRIAWQYFKRNPLDYRSQGTRGSEDTFEIVRGEMVQEPEQFLGGPGDLLIWHALTLHSASMNLQPRPRLALIGRWGTEVTQEHYFDFDGDMWAEWEFAVGRDRPSRESQRA